MSKRRFDNIVENALSRFQRTEFLVGDAVEFVDPKIFDSWENSKDEWIKRQSSGMIDKIKGMVAGGNPIKVTAIKGLHDDGMKAGGNSESPDFHYCDVVEELAPGRFWNVTTIPVRMLKRVDLGNNVAVRIDGDKERISGAHIDPEELVNDDSDEMGAQKMTGVNDGDKTLTTKNKKLKGAIGAKSYTAGYMTK